MGNTTVNQDKSLLHIGPDAIRRLLSECDHYLKTPVLIALLTGMRRAQILNLKWSQVNLDNRWIIVYHVMAGTETRIPINDTLFDLLTDLKKRVGSDYICAPQGQQPTDIDKECQNAVKRASIEGLRCFHDLRKWFGYYLAQAGVEAKIISYLLGHFGTPDEKKPSGQKLRDAVAHLDVLFELINWREYYE